MLFQQILQANFGINNQLSRLRYPYDKNINTLSKGNKGCSTIIKMRKKINLLKPELIPNPLNLHPSHGTPNT